MTTIKGEKRYVGKDPKGDYFQRYATIQAFNPAPVVPEYEKIGFPPDSMLDPVNPDSSPSWASKIKKYLHPPPPKKVLLFGNVERLRGPDSLECVPEKKQPLKENKPVEYVDLDDLL